MSLIQTLFSWLFGSSTTSQNALVINDDQPCRYRLDNGTSSTLTLPDGRKLGYAEYGSPTGKAILYHHGFPGSRLEGAQHHELCTELGLRMICIDRPGIGWSSPHPSSKLLDWPNDIEYLTEHLGLDSYSVLVSSETPRNDSLISYKSTGSLRRRPNNSSMRLRPPVYQAQIHLPRLRGRATRQRLARRRHSAPNRLAIRHPLCPVLDGPLVLAHPSHRAS